MSTSYRALHARSLADPEGFWLEAAAAVDWSRPPTRALDEDARPAARWFPDGELSTCHNAVDRHVDAGHGDRLALVHDSAYTGRVTRMTYAELQGAVARLAGALQARGVGRGDRVIVYMPMIPQAVVAMLACARLGAVHSVVFGGFAAKELAARIADARPVAVITASCGLEPGRVVEYLPLLDAAVAMVDPAVRPRVRFVARRPEAATEPAPDDVDLDEAIATGPPVPCTPVVPDV
jgi:propionyl-CoA synthetase